MSPRPTPDAGFTLTEALMALVVLALAMSQLPTLVSQLAHRHRQTMVQARATEDALDRVRSVHRGPSVDAVSADDAGLQHVPTLGLEYHTPCQFDNVGRRCL